MGVTGGRATRSGLITPPAYSNHYQVAQKTSLGSAVVKSGPYASNNADDENDAEGDDDEMDGEHGDGLAEGSLDNESFRNDHTIDRADSKVSDDNYTPRKKQCSSTKQKERSFSSRRPTDKLHKETLLRNELRRVQAQTASNKTLRSDSSVAEPFKPTTKALDMEDTVAEPSKVTNEPYGIVDSPLKPGTKFFLVECGHHDSSKNRLGDNTDMYQLNGLHPGHADAINAAVENLTEIMREADWRGDYTVWISPLSGPDKQERVRFIYGQIQNYETALSELQQLPLWQDGYCTMVYMTSKNGKLRWFVKMTPFESRHFCDGVHAW